jgi:dTDP-4-dehydrorhamnose 3,5-epimerase
MNMKMIETALPGVLVFEPRRFGDARGFFREIFQAERYAAFGVKEPFVQDNLSRSAQGVLRGLHLQWPQPQAKLVSVVRGRVLDVAVDVRIGSPTFGKHMAVELDEESGRQLFIPRGFAHGFVVLSESADFFYKCDNLYNPSSEITVRWCDPVLGIDWRIRNPIVSARDTAAPLLGETDGLPRYVG